MQGMYVVIPATKPAASTGKPAINFDGNDSFWTAQKFNAILNKGYTIFTIARYTGGDNERVFTTRDGRNWLFGYHGNTVRRWYSDGWIHNQGGADTSWHMHIGDMGASGVGDPEANFWLDGQQLRVKGKGSHNNNTYPTDFQIGGYRGNNEYSKCEVSEVLIYKKVLSNDEREIVQGYLAHKYKMAGTLPAKPPLQKRTTIFSC